MATDLADGAQLYACCDFICSSRAYHQCFNYQSADSFVLTGNWDSKMHLYSANRIYYSLRRTSGSVCFRSNLYSVPKN